MNTLKLAVVGLLIGCASTFAQGPNPFCEDRFDVITYGQDRDGQIVDLFVRDDAQINGDTTLGGPLTMSNGVGATFNGGVTVNGADGVNGVATTITNGQIIVLTTNPVLLVTCGGAHLTVTATIAAVSSTYTEKWYTFINVGASNALTITDAAPVYNSGASLGITDSSTYYTADTNVVIQTATSNN